MNADELKSNVYVTKYRQRRGGRNYAYWVLKRNVWDRDEQRITRQEYLASLGTKLTVPRSKAEQIVSKVSDKLGEPFTVDDLANVKRVRIVDDPAD